MNNNNNNGGNHNSWIGVTNNFQQCPQFKNDYLGVKEQQPSTKFEEYLFSSDIEKEDCNYFKVHSIGEKEPTQKRSLLHELLDKNGPGLKERDRELY